ncbi:MAG: type II toxin-antitoxin system MqsA family antitoxin [Selenomonadaceae bacterium]|nr:type II toxin-antitoxin system MqsA family antitoxin [Selenomonadaceae bacterium]
MCRYCKGGDYVESTTTHVVDFKDHLIIVRNVPCLECDQCGETYFTDDVAEQLEKIVNEAKKFSQEVSIIDYNKAA